MFGGAGEHWQSRFSAVPVVVLRSAVAPLSRGCVFCLGGRCTQRFLSPKNPHLVFLMELNWCRDVDKSLPGLTWVQLWDERWHL